MMNPTPVRDLPAWWWAGLPLAMFVLTLYATFIGPAELLTLLIRRDTDPAGGGIAEHATVLVLLPGMAAGLAVLRHYRTRLPLWFYGWVLGWTLACLYFAGEEASWGQHYFHWATPETLQGLNDQNETNLHNIGTWFDQKPRTLVELWIVVAGLIVPIVTYLRPEALWMKHESARMFWPTRIGALTVVLFLVARVIGVVAKQTGSITLHHFGSNELREFYIAMFLSTYLLSLWYRQRQTPQI